MKNLAIITARSGSKGLSDKNIRLLNGKPLMWYSVDAAVKSGMYDEIMVSTDSERYAEIAIECGAKVPFLRSEEAAADTASTAMAVREVLEEYQNLNMNFDTVTVLQPTSPLRTAEHIMGAFELKKAKNAKAVVGVSEMDYKINVQGYLNESLSMEDFFIFKGPEGVRRQDMGRLYRINGALYVVDTDIIMNNMPWYSSYTFAYEMERRYAVDVDTIDDFEYAEFIINRK